MSYTCTHQQGTISLSISESNIYFLHLYTETNLFILESLPRSEGRQRNEPSFFIFVCPLLLVLFPTSNLVHSTVSSNHLLLGLPLLRAPCTCSFRFLGRIPVNFPNYTVLQWKAVLWIRSMIRLFLISYITFK